ncbi:putative glutamyl-tRNA(Gln) amidotransferase subunit F, mitochondrial [[Candida] jaroonii]|uniref:Glutamyl-tRNA(Gln) amidotransferase subunit F, mitochondrial n=1 Tax=[Candida] jaroonii TaxID=467808 RepID=A0ACA9Y9E8_9ASCO|nr:putative glutamyl-tRNA(Gln) amidotransferase subunit F, mitochondrial [[Candida] jaroonii]
MPIGKPITKSQITNLLKPTWSVNSILNSTKIPEISQKTVDKMIFISGLDDDLQFKQSLEKQLSVVNELDKGKGDNNSLFRLLKSDFHPVKMNLQQIQEDIRNLRPREDKGEVGFGKHDYYVVRSK